MPQSLNVHINIHTNGLRIIYLDFLNDEKPQPAERAYFDMLTVSENETVHNHTLILSSSALGYLLKLLVYILFPLMLVKVDNISDILDMLWLGPCEM